MWSACEGNTAENATRLATEIAAGNAEGNATGNAARITAGNAARSACEGNAAGMSFSVPGNWGPPRPLPEACRRNFNPL